MAFFVLLLAYVKSPDLVVVDPIRRTNSVNSSFYGYWSVVSNGTVDYVGVFNLASYKKAQNKSSQLGNFSTIIQEYKKPAVKIDGSTALISNGYLIDGKYSTSLYYFMQAYGNHFYDESRPETAAGYIEFYIPARFSQNVVYEHSKEELETLREQALKAQWPSDNQTQISDESYEDVNSGRVSMYSCPFRFYYSLKYEQRPAKEYMYPWDMDLQFRDFYPTSDSAIVDIVALNATLISQECASHYVISGEIANSAWMIKQSFIYALPMIFVTVLGIVSAARLLHLTNSTLRAYRISLASMALQTACDLVMAFYQMNAAIQVPKLHAHLLVVSANYFIMAVAFDITLLSQVYLAHLAARGQQPNPRAICKIMMFSYLGFFVLFFIIQIIPQWGIFLLVTAASSYWILQSVHAFVRNTPGKPLPLDYLAFQTLCKYAPVIYFYGVRSNFMGYEILSWYPYVLWIWSGIQVFLIFMQYIFGNRCGIRLRHKKKEQEYNYDAQVPRPMLITDSAAFVPAGDIVQSAQAEDIGVFQYLVRYKYDFPIPFAAPTLQLSSEDAAPENDSADTQCQELCMNPLHRHSKLFYEGISQEEVLLQLPFLDRQCSGQLASCFYLAKREDLDQFMICTICIDAVRLDEIENVSILSLYEVDGKENSSELTFLKKQNYGAKESLYITPCGHCFHKDCLQKWASENAQCPVDRQAIPPCGQAVWYE